MVSWHYESRRGRQVLSSIYSQLAADALTGGNAVVTIERELGRFLDGVFGSAKALSNSFTALEGMPG